MQCQSPHSNQYCLGSDDGLAIRLAYILQARHPKSPKLIGGRNWCEVTEMPSVANDQPGGTPRTSGALQFSLRVENPMDMEAEPEVYTTPVPIYVPARRNTGCPHSSWRYTNILVALF